MEFCTIEDAFPDLGSQKIARKEEKRRAKRCKGPALTYLEPDTGLLPVTDPDRPAVKRMSEVSPINPATGLREHAPVDAPQPEPFSDMTGEYRQLLASLQSEKAPEPLTSVLNTMPKGVAGPTKLEPPRIQVPSFFGAGEDDEDVKEGFASYTNVIGDDPGYKLSPDFGATFMGKGLAKAGGSSLPETPSNLFWKPLTGAGAKTSFYSKADLQMPKAQPQAVPGDVGEVLRRLDKIFTRLDDLESRRSENANTEVVLFVMTGLFVMFSMDLLVRKTGNVRLLR
jgi:hypothetical protein